MIRIYVAVVLLMAGFPALANEVCRYRGTGSYSTDIQAQTEVETVGDQTHLHVHVVLKASPLFYHVEEYLDETTVWDHNRELLTVESNRRLFSDGSPVRQIWDIFKRTDAGMEGYRIQGTTQAKYPEFAQKFAGFTQHWDRSQFTRDWADDFWKSHPERRADLDLNDNGSSGLMTPLSAGFYWIRWSPTDIPAFNIFAAGEERDKKYFSVTPSSSLTSTGGVQWDLPMVLGDLKTSDGYPAQFIVSPQQTLERIRLSLSYGIFSLDGEIALTGCQNL